MSDSSDLPARRAEVSRGTKETQVQVQLNLDGAGTGAFDTPVGFLNHMLDLLTRHALIDLTVRASGDTEVDLHHITEDIGICLGRALNDALGEKKGITRYGHAFVPMDEALARVVVDLGGRPYFVYRVSFDRPKVGKFDTELVEEFLRAFCVHAKMNLHVLSEYGKNSHHVAESIFKALARALRTACSLDPRVSGVPSTKGTL